MIICDVRLKGRGGYTSRIAIFKEGLTTGARRFGCGMRCGVLCPQTGLELPDIAVVATAETSSRTQETPRSRSPKCLVTNAEIRSRALWARNNRLLG